MQILLWGGFLAFIALMLAIDLGIFHKESHVVTAHEAMAWTGVWIALSLLFNVVVYFMYENHWLGIGERPTEILSGGHAALQFFTGYIVELSLSLDNVFVIAIIFRYFRIPRQYQHRVLFWGIVGAQILRGIMILAGAALIARFSITIYFFGALLLFTAARMLLAGEEEVHPEKNPLVRLARKIYPVTHELEGEKFFTEIGGKRAITPLFLVLLIVESTDVLFAVDSIPAIFAVTQDPFLVFTSNMFAILGLRSMYFALAAMIEHFRFLKPSLVFLLAFIGIKMLLTHHFPIPTAVSLIIISGILGVGVVASLIHAAWERRKAQEEDRMSSVDSEDDDADFQG